MYYYQPGGTSTKNLIHWLQILNGELRLFDYGAVKNLQVYNATEPPQYNLDVLKDFDIDIFITTTDGDPYCQRHDVENMLQIFTKSNITVKDLHNYNHLDYLWSKTAYDDIYRDLLKFLNDI
jgi:predicted alpha/beta hydrolase